MQCWALEKKESGLLYGVLRKDEKFIKVSAGAEEEEEENDLADIKTQIIQQTESKSPQTRPQLLHINTEYRYLPLRS